MNKNDADLAVNFGLRLKNLESKVATTQKDVKNLEGEINTMITDQKTSTELVRDMHRVLVGDEEYGLPGYKQRLEKVEELTRPKKAEKTTNFLGFELTSREKLFLLIGFLAAASGWTVKITELFGISG